MADFGGAASGGVFGAGAGAAIGGDVGAVAGGAVGGVPGALVGEAAGALAGSVAGAVAGSVTGDALANAIGDAMASFLGSIAGALGGGNGGNDGAEGGAPDGDDPSDPGAPAGGGGDSGSAAGNMGDGNGQTDPLVLDLTGNGFNLSALSPTSPYVDFTGTGFAQKTGWTGAGCGLLCAVDSSGNATLFTGSGGTSNGFSQLAGLDANHDGQITDADPGWSSLRVWVDANNNGVVDPGELETLGQLGITSISLTTSADDQTVAGNLIGAIGSYTLSDGTTRSIADVSFETSPTYTRPDVAVPISADIAALPQVPGYGSVADLHSAMATDATLATLVQGFVALPASTTPANIDAAVQGIMFEWAGVTNISSALQGYVNGQQYAFAEKYTGVTGESYPWHFMAAFYNQAWTNLFDGIEARLVLQSPLAALVPEFVYNAAADFVLPVTSLTASYADAYARLGAPSASNILQWDLVFRASDAFRMDAHVSSSTYVAEIAAGTNDTVASLANAISTNVQVGFNANGTTTESSTGGGSVMYAGPGISELYSYQWGGQEAIPTHDTSVYSAGDGTVEISESDNRETPVPNVLEFGAGITPSQVAVTGDGSGNVYLTDGVNGDQIKLDGELIGSGNGVQQVTFADGTSWNKQQLIAHGDPGTTGADKLYGTIGADTFDGKGAPAGSEDYEQGYGGGDTFIYDPGYGQLEHPLAVRRPRAGAAARLLLAPGQDIGVVNVGHPRCELPHQIPRMMRASCWRKPDRIPRATASRGLFSSCSRMRASTTFSPARKQGIDPRHSPRITYEGRAVLPSPSQDTRRFFCAALSAAGIVPHPTGSSGAERHAVRHPLLQ